MAYGIKYRLIFSDILGNGKKVEILQDGYSGEVLPMIGTGDPVQIEWEGDDDFYKPIIGSSCTINLLITDDVTYDDFFKGDEEEYRVQVFYDRNITENFQDRVESYQTNAGYFESPECIENQLSSGNTIQSDFTKRVLNDGGTIDNETCIAKSITNDKTYDWQTLWEGFLYLDNYSEALTTTPYEISITALDGLGLLDVENTRALNNNVNPVLTSANLGEWYFVSEMLQKFNQDDTATNERQLYWAGDIQDDGTSTPPRPWSIYSNIDTDFNFLNEKEVLENILRKSNSRIFHAFGDWYVVPNSIYLDDVFSDQYYDRSVFKNALSNGQNEIIDFQVFSVGASRDFEGNASRNVTRRMKRDLQPLGNDLSIEYLSPLNKVIVKSDLEQSGFIRGALNYGQGFTFGSNGYTFTYGGVSSAIPYVASNNQAYKVVFYTTNSSTRTQAFYSNARIVDGNFNPADNIEFGFEYLFDSSASSIDYTLYYAVELQYRVNDTFPWTTRYLDVENNSLSTSIVYNERVMDDIKDLQSWQKVDQTLSKDFIFFRNFNINIFFYLPYIATGTSGYSSMYIDNVYARNTDYLKEEKTLTSTTTENRGVYDLETVANEENVNSFFDSSVTTLLEIDDDKNITQQILNDYRSYVPRYEGTGYGLKKKPVTPIDKLYMDFENFKEDQASMIDTLKYNLRRNEAEFVAHTPNNDPDVTVTHQIKEK